MVILRARGTIYVRNEVVLFSSRRRVSDFCTRRSGGSGIYNKIFENERVVEIILVNIPCAGLRRRHSSSIGSSHIS